MSEVLTDQFDAMDATENVFTICQYQAVMASRGLSGSTMYESGEKRFALLDGRSVNVTGQVNVFEIVDTGVLVHRILKGGAHV